MAENENPQTPPVTEQPVGTGQPATEPQGNSAIDYEAEYKAAVALIEQQAEHNRQGYMMRKQENTEAPSQEDIDTMVAEAIKKALPQIQTAVAQDSIETMLGDLSQGNEAKKKLIRFHFENSIAPNGTIRERLENAAILADKNTILKTQQELAVALKNRQGLGATGAGTSTEGMEVPDNFFSKEQLAELRAKGWDDAKIQKLKENMLRR